jgi:hypothetical protein
MDLENAQQETQEGFYIWKFIDIQNNQERYKHFFHCSYRFDYISHALII